MKGESGVVAWDGEEPTGGRQLLCGGMMLGHGIQSSETVARAAPAAAMPLAQPLPYS